MIGRSYSWCCALAFCAWAAAGVPDRVNADTLWQIGKVDGSDVEFALAPGDAVKGFPVSFPTDPTFAIGASDRKKDWPYVQPGPDDAWAGGVPHVFSVVFGLRDAPTAGACQLVLNLIDAQYNAPPRVVVAVNGKSLPPKVPEKGTSDAAIFGDPAQGRHQSLTFDFPAVSLRSGGNLLTITTESGSWILYDASAWRPRLAWN